MTHHPSPNASSSGKSRERILAFVTVLLATAVSLLAAEWLLGWYDARVAGSSDIDPGLLAYDAELGWVLTRNWQGRHRHHDFDVAYAINAEGFRGPFPTRETQTSRRRVAVLGDSFTFGLGVDDDATFVSALSRLDPGADYLNFAVPGYSTDQELLLSRRILGRYRPDVVMLGFYLGNDLLDNALDYPLQADQGKPYFQRRDDGSLALRNVPVPRGGKPAVARARTIESIVFGEAFEQRRWWLLRLHSASHLLQRLPIGNSIADTEDELRLLFATRLEMHRQLLSAELDAMNADVHLLGAELVLLVLPGNSLIEQPNSPAGAFQKAVAEFVVAEAARLGVMVVDPTAELRVACQAASTPCFHPNEGHYRPVAHRIIAELLWRSGKERAAGGRPSSVTEPDGSL
jgi:hypothetical protein